MPQRVFETLIFWTLLLATGVALFLSVPDVAVLTQYSGSLILYVLLTAFALIFSAALVQGELGAAHSIGILAALSLPAAAHGATTWAIALGGLIGGALIVFTGDRRLPWQRPQERTLSALLLIVVRVTLSFFLATGFYEAIGGALPIQLNNLEHALWVVGFCLLYTTIYLILFLLEMYGRDYGMRRILRANVLEVLTVLGLPLPLSVLGAHIYINLSILAFAICMLGLSLAIVAPYVISRAQQRLRKQVEELRSLSVMSQAIRANYQYASLMNMVYVQVSNLLNINNFTVALYDPHKQDLEYPLVIRNGKEVKQSPAPLPANSPINRVLETQQPLLLARDAQKDGWVRGLSVPEGDYSWLGVPLQAGGSLLGVIVVTSPNQRRAFNADDLRLLNIVASSTSVALDNSLLYEQQKKRAHKLTQLNTMLAQLTETLSPDAVLETIVQEATTLANADAATVMLVKNGENIPRLAQSVGLGDTFKTKLSAPIVFNHTTAATQSAPLLIPDVRDDARAASIREAALAEGIFAWIEL
ncbi:MAG: GAF domain-containing protein, partial [Anaerolineae bacterium]|nr:GAF domain-containing protein [Anaerolineae bacterium]